MFHKLIYNLDFLGVQPSILFLGKKQHSTNLSLTLSILSFVVILGFAVFFLISLFGREVSIISKTQSKIRNPIMNFTGLPMILKVVDGGNLEVVDDPRFFQMQVVFSKNHDGFWENQYPDLERCDMNTHFNDHIDYFKQINNITSYYCIKNLKNFNVALYGTNGDLSNGFGTIDIILNFCNNDTLLMQGMQGTCAPQYEIDKKLQSIFVSFGFLDYLVDNNNIERPVQLTLKTEFLPFSSTTFTRYFFEKRTLSYSTDMGYAFPDIKQIKAFQQDAKQVYVDLSVKLIKGDERTKEMKFGQISLFMNCNLDSYMRSFSKIQDTLANIGGIMNLMILIAYLVVNFVNKRMYFLKLANTFFKLRRDGRLMREATDIIREMKRKKGIGKTGFEGPLIGNRFNGEAGILNHKKKESKNLVSKTSKKTIEKLIKNEGDLPPPEEDICDPNRNDSLKKNPILRQIESPTSLPFSAINENKNNIEINFDGRVDENGKLKIDLRNIFFPNEGISKIIKIVQKKISIDEILKLCSQFEKVKKFLFDEDDLAIFNNLPDLDFQEVFLEAYVQKSTSLRHESSKNSLYKFNRPSPSLKSLKIMS